MNRSRSASVMKLARTSRLSVQNVALGTAARKLPIPPGTTSTRATTSNASMTTAISILENDLDLAATQGQPHFATFFANLVHDRAARSNFQHAGSCRDAPVHFLDAEEGDALLQIDPDADVERGHPSKVTLRIGSSNRADGSQIRESSHLRAGGARGSERSPARGRARERRHPHRGPKA